MRKGTFSSILLIFTAILAILIAFFALPATNNAEADGKESIEKCFRDFTPDSYVFIAGLTYQQPNVLSQIYSDPALPSNADAYNLSTMTVTRNGVQLGSSDLLGDAGTYGITVEYAGNELYYPASYHFEFTISKAAAPVSVLFAAGDFDNVSTTYDGVTHAVSTPTATNESELNSYGYTYSFALFKGENARTTYSEAGTYVQKATATSTNYADIVVTRNVIVNKKSLRVTVGDLTCDYNSSPDFTSVTLTPNADDLVSADRSTAISVLFPDYTTHFVAPDYTVGDAVGTYGITFNGSATNYELAVTDGALTVEPIDIPIADVGFYGADRGLNGATNATYTSSAIVLAATYADYLAVSYGNNANKNVGSHTVTATFTAANYNDLTLNTVLTITPATLTLTATDMTVPYGTAWQSGTYSVTGYCANDDATVIEGITFAVQLQDGGNVVAADTVLAVGFYVLHPTYSASPTNYAFNAVDGVYTVEKAFLTELYDNNASQNTDFADISRAYDGNNVTSQITYFADNDLSVSIVYSTEKGGEVYSDPVVNVGSYTVTAVVTPTGALADNYKVTEYVRSVTISKRPTSITFTPSVCEFEYNAVDRAIITDFSYTDTLPTGVTPTLTCTKAGVAAAAIDVGEYVITLAWAGNDNEEGCSDTATLMIIPKQITLAFRQEYTYTGTDIVPELISVEGDIDDAIDASDMTFTYYNPSGTPVGHVINVHTELYSFTVTLTDNNYCLAPDTTFYLRVNKAHYDVTFGSISYVYGYTGDMIADGVTYIVYPTTVTRMQYTLPDSTKVNLTVNNLPSYATVFNPTDADLSDTSNYDFSLVGTNKITILRRTLTVTMKVDGNAHNSDNYADAYRGASQNARFTFDYANFAPGESASDIGQVQQDVRGTSALVMNQTVINNVGTYRISLALNPEVLNYELGTTYFTVTIEKALLTVVVGNVYVQEREVLPDPPLTLNGLVGGDIGKTADELNGATLNYVTGYTTAARVPATFSLQLNATFNNYTADVLPAGGATVTVVANDYPQYALNNASFVYDGTYKTMTIPDVNPDLSVVYTNNSHRDAGYYTVGAEVTYPTGRVESLSATMTIVKANPTVVMPELSVVFVHNAILGDDLLDGKAYVGNNEVPGVFSFAEEYVMKSGVNSYGYHFVPTDWNNINGYSGQVELNAVAVNMSIFRFDPINGLTYTQIGDNDASVTVTKPTKLYIGDNPLGLKLYRDEYEVEYVEFVKTERIRVTVKHNDATVYYVDYNVKYSDPTVGPADGKIDETILSGDGLVVEGKSIKVNEGGGRISLAEEAKIDYNLFVNGYATDSYILNGDEEMVTVIIKSKKTGKTVYSGKFTVSVVEQREEVKKNLTIYYIIGGVGGGLLIIGGVFLFLWKKKHG